MSQPERRKLHLERLQAALANVPQPNIEAEQIRLSEEKRDVDEDSREAFRAEELITLKHFNKTLEENIRLRRKYAHHIFFFTCGWALIIFAILILRGFATFECFYLSDSVLITLITTTTVNAFGFFVLVVKYLFNNNHPNSGGNKIGKD